MKYWKQQIFFHWSISTLQCCFLCFSKCYMTCFSLACTSCTMSALVIDVVYCKSDTLLMCYELAHSQVLRRPSCPSSVSFIQRARWLRRRAGGFNPIQPRLLSRRNQGTKVFPFYVQLVIYSCASHKVNHPRSHTVTRFLPVREQSEAQSSQQQPVITKLFVFIHSFKYLGYVCVLVTCCVHATYAAPISEKWGRTKPLEACTSYLCIPPWLLCAVIIYSPSSWMFLGFFLVSHNKSCTARENVCQTFFFPLVYKPHWVR